MVDLTHFQNSSSEEMKNLKILVSTQLEKDFPEHLSTPEMIDYITLLLCSGKEVDELVKVLEEFFTGKLERLFEFFEAIFRYISTNEKEFAPPSKASEKIPVTEPRVTDDNKKKREAKGSVSSKRPHSHSKGEELSKTRSRKNYTQIVYDRELLDRKREEEAARRASMEETNKNSQKAMQDRKLKFSVKSDNEENITDAIPHIGKMAIKQAPVKEENLESEKQGPAVVKVEEPEMVSVPGRSREQRVKPKSMLAASGFFKHAIKGLIEQQAQEQRVPKPKPVQRVSEKRKDKDKTKKDLDKEDEMEVEEEQDQYNKISQNKVSSSEEYVELSHDKMDMDPLPAYLQKPVAPNQNEHRSIFDRISYADNDERYYQREVAYPEELNIPPHSMQRLEHRPAENNRYYAMEQSQEQRHSLPIPYNKDFTKRDYVRDMEMNKEDEIEFLRSRIFDLEKRVTSNYNVIPQVLPVPDIYTVIVENVFYGASKESIASHFALCGPIVNIIFPPDSNSTCFIQFTNATSVAKAVAMTKTYFLNRCIKVRREAIDPSLLVEAAYNPMMPPGSTFQSMNPWGMPAPYPAMDYSGYYNPRPFRPPYSRPPFARSQSKRGRGRGQGQQNKRQRQAYIKPIVAQDDDKVKDYVSPEKQPAAEVIVEEINRGPVPNQEEIVGKENKGEKEDESEKEVQIMAELEVAESKVDDDDAVEQKEEAKSGAEYDFVIDIGVDEKAE